MFKIMYASTIPALNSSWTGMANIGLLWRIPKQTKTKKRRKKEEDAAKMGKIEERRKVGWDVEDSPPGNNMAPQRFKKKKFDTLDSGEIIVVVNQVRLSNKPATF